MAELEIELERSQWELDNSANTIRALRNDVEERDDQIKERDDQIKDLEELLEEMEEEKENVPMGAQFIGLALAKDKDIAMNVDNGEVSVKFKSEPKTPKKTPKSRRMWTPVRTNSYSREPGTSSTYPREDID